MVASSSIRSLFKTLLAAGQLLLAFHDKVLSEAAGSRPSVHAEVGIRLESVQAHIDKWTARGYRLVKLTALRRRRILQCEREVQRDLAQEHGQRFVEGFFRVE